RRGARRSAVPHRLAGTSGRRIHPYGATPQMNLAAIQEQLRESNLDGWLFFDHHQRDPLAYRILGLGAKGHVSRRWYFFIPSAGEPRGLVHRIEAKMLDELPGERIRYSTWQEQAEGIAKLLGGA